MAHIGADNVQALLLAAKDDPKLLPSFLLPDGVTSEKEDGKNSVEKAETKTGVSIRLSRVQTEMKKAELRKGVTGQRFCPFHSSCCSQPP